MNFLMSRALQLINVPVLEFLKCYYDEDPGEEESTTHYFAELLDDESKSCQ
jgi:hypothetical protein